MNDVIIIGGGLAGLACSIQLAEAGLDVLVVEKKSYPFHRVCGEYISNESLPFLKSIGADPSPLGPSCISKLLVSSPSGNTLSMPLDLGGFGISRYSLDELLYKVALRRGVSFQLNTTVNEVTYQENVFSIQLSDGTDKQAPIVIGSYGKRSNLDRQLQRPFFQTKSPYLAVKYHIQTEFPDDLIALHNFKDGYCGISKVEDNKYCLCYMTTRDNLRTHGTIPEMEEQLLYRNKFLQNIFTNSDFLFDKPEVINEISFASKSPVDHHLLMTGDAAGMIAPLCGNGMSMALHSSKILSGLIVKYYSKNAFKKDLLEKEYTREWSSLFSNRLLIGRTVQQLFGREMLTDITVKFLHHARPVSKWIVRQTHGQPY